MTPPATQDTTITADPVAQLLRSRRMQREWSFARLAKAARLKSPAYVFHIENGTKTPRPGVARRLAVALGLDPELLAAWAIARGRADLAAALGAAKRIEAWLAQTDLRPQGGRGQGSEAPTQPDRDARHEPHPEFETHPTAENQASADSIAVPIFPEGADPLSDDPATQAIETLRIERALLPPLGALARLVGYRLSAHGASRIPESLRAGDCVIVLLGDEPAGPDTPCAVRVRSRIEIVRQPAGTPGAHLPPPRPANDSEGSSTPTARADSGVTIGRVVLAVRRWL